MRFFYCKTLIFNLNLGVILLRLLLLFFEKDLLKGKIPWGSCFSQELRCLRIRLHLWSGILRKIGIIIIHCIAGRGLFRKIIGTRWITEDSVVSYDTWGVIMCNLWIYLMFDVLHFQKGFVVFHLQIKELIMLFEFLYCKLNRRFRGGRNAC